MNHDTGVQFSTILAAHRSTYGFGDTGNTQGLRFEHKNSRVNFLLSSLPSGHIQLLGTPLASGKNRGSLIKSSVRTEFGSAGKQGLNTSTDA